MEITDYLQKEGIVDVSDSDIEELYKERLAEEQWKNLKR